MTLAKRVLMSSRVGALAHRGSRLCARAPSSAGRSVPQFQPGRRGAVGARHWADPRKLEGDLLVLAGDDSGAVRAYAVAAKLAPAGAACT